jgi:lipoprotein-anchoring transpeptidase ErfK/SrfK
MCSGRATLIQSSPAGKSGARTVPAYERSAIDPNGTGVAPPGSGERYNSTNTMGASGYSQSRAHRPAWLARRPSKRTLLIAVVAAGLVLSSRGANAVALNGERLHGATPESRAAAAEVAAIQAEASRLRNQYQADPAALLGSAQAALSAGRNDAAIALFLKRGWANRLSAALERYGAMLAPSDPQHLALAAAGIQHYATQLHSSLLRNGPLRLITISLHEQRLIAYDRGRVLVDALVTTGRPELATDIGAMRVIRKDSPWTMQSPWPKGSPAWYPDTPVRMVLWFTENGEGLHDASWQPDSTLGPGSQNGRYASHGCVHLPLAAVTTLFQWAPIGTPVVVYPGDGSPGVVQVAQQTVDAAGSPTGGVRGA